jgi:hypothetical protein
MESFSSFSCRPSFRQLIPPENHPSAQPKVFPSPQKPLPLTNLFPPDADTNPRGAVGAALLNRLFLFRKKWL